MTTPEYDGMICDCSPRRRGQGWTGKPPVPVDGKNWPLDFAAKMLDLPERDLRDLIRVTGLEPTGTMNVAKFRRSGRYPRVYDAGQLVMISQAVRELRVQLGTLDLG